MRNAQTGSTSCGVDLFRKEHRPMSLRSALKQSPTAQAEMGVGPTQFLDSYADFDGS